MSPIDSAAIRVAKNRLANFATSLRMGGDYAGSAPRQRRPA
ncbi:hypothetical protein PLANPX_0593 [Lacipirellula parvula]|uniref:Uncharacterized protein n=1 Tax=Lacipirellula parvula TaxID=2650471 RepID=A0A5K7X898_9BACT|nr:hypothetical protein PLANPX_0593 [Lacipirellula parvula]